MSFRLSSLLRSQLVRLGGTLIAAAALAGCGGSVVDPFQPARIVSLGDEYSYIDGSTGRKFTVNVYKTAEQGQASEIDCSANPLWNQTFVESYGFSFTQCNPRQRDASRQALLRAGIGARAADIATQMGTVPDLGSGDMVLLLVGANDIWSAHESNPGDDAAADAAVSAAAAEVIGQLRRMVDLKSKVVLLTVPNQGATPDARERGEAAAARLSRLTRLFNDRMSILLNQAGQAYGGRHVVLVQAEGLIGQIQNPDTGLARALGINNLNDPACATETDPAADADSNAGLDCSHPGNAVSNYAEYLYSDKRYLSTRANAQLFQLAESRARSNPL